MIRILAQAIILEVQNVVKFRNDRPQMWFKCVSQCVANDHKDQGSNRSNDTIHMQPTSGACSRLTRRHKDTDTTHRHTHRISYNRRIETHGSLHHADRQLSSSVDP
jgi:hypothetical protein